MTGDSHNFDQLSESRYATLMVRMLLNRANRLVEGELVDLDGNLVGRFATCSGLARVLHRWVSTPPPGERST